MGGACCRSLRLLSSSEEQVAMKWAASSRGPPRSLQLGSPGLHSSCERLKVLVHCTFEWGVKSVEQKASYAKSKQATEPQFRLTRSLLVATITQNFMQFCCTVMEIYSIPNYLVYSIKRLSTPKANKLQSPKLRLTQSLLVATLTQNFMRFRCTVMEKRHQNFPPHSSVCDDRYCACTFAWDKLCALFTPH